MVDIFSDGGRSDATGPVAGTASDAAARAARDAASARAYQSLRRVRPAERCGRGALADR